jgi:hypothetical protein
MTVENISRAGMGESLKQLKYTTPLETLKSISKTE